MSLLDTVTGTVGLKRWTGVRFAFPKRFAFEASLSYIFSFDKLAIAVNDDSLHLVYLSFPSLALFVVLQRKREFFVSLDRGAPNILVLVRFGCRKHGVIVNRVAIS